MFHIKQPFVKGASEKGSVGSNKFGAKFELPVPSLPITAAGAAEAVSRREKKDNSMCIGTRLVGRAEEIPATIKRLRGGKGRSKWAPTHTHAHTTALQRAAAVRSVRVRAWEGDTVYDDRRGGDRPTTLQERRRAPEGSPSLSAQLPPKVSDASALYAARATTKARALSQLLSPYEDRRRAPAASLSYL